MVEDGDERVEQAGIQALAGRLTQPVVQLVGGLPAEVVRSLDARADQHPGDGGPDVGECLQIGLAHTAFLPGGSPARLVQIGHGDAVASPPLVRLGSVIRPALRASHSATSAVRAFATPRYRRRCFGGVAGLRAVGGVVFLSSHARGVGVVVDGGCGLGQ